MFSVCFFPHTFAKTRKSYDNPRYTQTVDF